MMLDIRGVSTQSIKVVGVVVTTLTYEVPRTKRNCQSQVRSMVKPLDGKQESVLSRVQKWNQGLLHGCQSISSTV